MSTHPEIAHLSKDERIRAIAYSLWEEEGHPEGRDLEHWTRACELVEAEAAETGDPAWLQRSGAEATTPLDSAGAKEIAGDSAAEKKTSLDDLVKRMKGSRAA